MIKTPLPLLLLAFGCNSDSDINKVGGRNGGGDGRDTGTEEEEEVDWTLSVELTPTEVYTNDTVTAVPSTDGTDESPTISYAFSVDDSVAQDGDTTTLDGTTHFSKGQSITVTASSGSQNATSEPVVVLNTPPTAPVLSMLSTAADAACAEGWFNTPDGDSCAAPFFYDFDWYAADEHCLSLGGHLMNSESEAEDAFIQSHILPDTYLWIGLNDLDIEGYWGWTTGEEMVHTGWDPASSQPDSGATVTGTPDEDCVLMTMSGWHDYVCTSAVDYNGHICEVYAPQSLVCSIDEDSVDADDDAITYTFEWTANGTPFTAARTTVHPGDTVPNITGSEDETWVCTVTPNDGEIDGESATIEYGDDEEPCYGNERSCPGLSCLDILESGFSTGDGNYWINPDSAGVFDVYCDMTTDGGGWTMTAVSSSDGTETWTWNNRHYWDTDTTTFGSLDATNRDFKSPALHSVTGTGLLFTHAPSGEWAAYDGISTDSTLADMVAAAGEPVCYDESEGFPMTAGTLEDIAGVEEMIPSQLCSTNLYFNARDRDGSTGCPDGDRDHAYGPAWNGRGCYFDDVGNLASLGPATNAGSDGHSADLEYGHPMHEAVGFGYLLDLNTGSSDAAENYIQVFIR